MDREDGIAPEDVFTRRLQPNDASIRLIAYVTSTSWPNDRDVSSMIVERIRGDDSSTIVENIKLSSDGSLSSLSGYIASLEDIHPSTSPSLEPSSMPSSEPSSLPSMTPTVIPTASPSSSPSMKPSIILNLNENTSTESPSNTNSPSIEVSSNQLPISPSISPTYTTRVPVVSNLNSSTSDFARDGDPQTSVIVRMSSVAAIAPAAEAR